MLLYQLVAGHLPFQLELSRPAIFYKQLLHCQYPHQAQLSEDLQSLIKGLLVIDPKRRLTIQQIQESEWYCRKQAELVQSMQ